MANDYIYISKIFYIIFIKYINIKYINIISILTFIRTHSFLHFLFYSFSSFFILINHLTNCFNKIFNKLKWRITKTPLK